MQMRSLAQKAKDAYPSLAQLSTAQKNKVLRQMALSLIDHQAQILKANQKDLALAKENKLSPAMQDRLLLNHERIQKMAAGLKEVAKLPDPVGRVVSKTERPNGLRVQKVQIPLGVIAVVYESRPNVTVDAAGLCFKAGNAIILRGGKEAFFSNKVLVKILGKVLQEAGLKKELISFVPTTDRQALVELLQLDELIDIVIPRGGLGLMRFMSQNSKIPIIKHDQGICNFYVAEDAAIKQALELVTNSKVQRPGVCNALENLFIHQKIAPRFLPLLVKKLTDANVELRGDPKARKIAKQIKPAKSTDWQTEYLDLILSIKIVANTQEAIDLIRRYGSRHTEAIATKNKKTITEFLAGLDSSCIVVNASTRFNDGGELGLGAEIGISTTKLHAYGPMGLNELTTSRFVVWGKGQVRN